MQNAALDHSVAIIGAGLGGVAVAVKLLEQGVSDFVLLEKSERAGGTWYENTYPGCACDVPSQLYSYSFAPKHDWSHVYARQREIEAYIVKVARERGVEARVRCGVTLERAEWRESESTWNLQTSKGPMRVQALVAATGPLHEPALPKIAGLDAFAGPRFHSSRWDHSLDFSGKRVAVIGTGASAIQFVPAIQPQVKQLLVFQRTAPWVIPKLDVAVPKALQTAYKIAPPLQALSRSATYGALEMIGLAQRDNRAMRVLSHLAKLNLRQIRDPQLRAQLTPNFAIGCKRILLANNWYSTLQQDNCRVLSGSPQRITANSVVDADGTEHPVDAIVLGTGFKVTNNPVYGLFYDARGRSLADHWQGSPQAYLGTTVAGFPNLFLVAGPNTANGHTSLLIAMEAQASYIAQAVGTLRSGHALSVEVRRTTQDDYNAEVQNALSKSVWNAGGCASYYLDEKGANRAIYPWSTGSLEKRLGTFKLGDYKLKSNPNATAARAHRQPSNGCGAALQRGDVALVTGAASGIGLALTEALLQRGLYVVATDRNAAGLEATLAHSGAWTLALDVTDANAFAEVARKARERYGRIDYLFNNAGISVAGEARDFALQDWTSVFDVNLLGVVHGVRAVYDDMLRRGKGHIVNTSSAAGLVPMPMMASYSASKHAVVGLSMSLRTESADLGVAVSVVCPGVIKTAIQGTTRVVNYDKAVSQSKHASNGLSPERCAEAILRGVARNEAVIVVTPLAKALHWAYRISPELVDVIARQQLREIRKFRLLPTSSKPQADAREAFELNNATVAQ